MSPQARSTLVTLTRHHRPARSCGFAGMHEYTFTFILKSSNAGGGYRLLVISHGLHREGSFDHPELNPYRRTAAAVCSWPSVCIAV